VALASDLTSIGICARQADFLGDTTAVALSGTGTTQAAGTPLSSSTNQVETATGSDYAFVLPSTKTGQVARSSPATFVKQSRIFVRNDSGSPITIFPFKSTASPENINGQAVDTGIELPDSMGMIFYRISILNVLRWITIKSVDDLQSSINDISAYIVNSKAAGLAAVGTTQGTGTVLTAAINECTTATIVTDLAFVLPNVSSFAHSLLVLSNNSGITLSLFPASGQSTDLLGANNAISLPLSGTGRVMTLYPLTATKWISSGGS